MKMKSRNMFSVFLALVIVIGLILLLAIGLSAITTKSTSNPSKKHMEGFDEKKEYINGVDIIYWINTIV